MSGKAVKEKITMEWKIYKEYYRKTIFVILVLGIVTALACFITSFFFEDLIVEQSNSIAEQMLDEEKEEPTHVQTFYSILLNNLLVGVLIILSGFIPVYGFPTIYALLSFASVGIIAGYGMIMKHNVVQTMIIAFFPHAVIEIIPILYSIAIGTYVNKNMVKKVFFRKKEHAKFRGMIAQGITSYIMIIIPLFLLAALVEAFVTSRLVDIYL